MGADERKQRRVASELDGIVARFAERGAKVTDAVPAMTGIYPHFGGYANFEMPFVRHRLLARTPHGLIQEWVTWTGPTPGKLLRQDDQPAVLLFTDSRRYDKVIIAGRRFWVHSRYRQTINAWVTQPSIP